MSSFQKATTISLDVPPLSQSMYESMACPASYQTRYVWGIQSLANQYSELGQEVHRCMSEYVTHLRAEEREEDWPYFEKNLTRFTQEAQDILRGFIGKMTFDPRTILSTELRFEYPDAAGTPDLITMESPVDATIWDYKSYFEIIEANTFQSKLYPLLLFRHNPALETVRFVLVFMRYGQTREVTWTRDHVPFLETILRDARARQIEIHEQKEAATAVPGRVCETCPLLRTRRCQVDDWNPHAVMDDDDRLSYVIFLSSALKANNAILRDVARYRPVTTSDANGNEYQARFVSAEQRLLPLDPTIAVLDRHLQTTGENLREKTCVSRTSLRSLRSAKKRAALDTALREIERIKPKTKFKISGISSSEENDDE
jgi:PD-(D/E)XK nuclease superfamily